MSHSKSQTKKTRLSCKNCLVFLADFLFSHIRSHVDVSWINFPYALKLIFFMGFSLSFSVVRFDQSTASTIEKLQRKKKKITTVLKDWDWYTVGQSNFVLKVYFTLFFFNIVHSCKVVSWFFNIQLFYAKHRLIFPSNADKLVMTHQF